MSKAADMARISARGSFNLLWGLVASTVISAVGTIFIAKLLGDTNYGLYGIALTAPTLIGLFRDWGVNTAMIRYTAQYNAENKAADIRRIFIAGLVFETVLGLALSLFSFQFPGFLAMILNRPTIAPLIRVSSFVVLTSALLSTAQAAFTGLERMEFNSVTLICQAIIKSILIPALVVLGLSTYGAVLGYTVALLMAGLIGVLLMWTLYRNLPELGGKRLEILYNIKIMLKYGLPLSIASIIGGFQTQFYGVLIANPVYTSASQVGNYNLAMNFAVLITFFATPVTTMMFPAFSKVDAKDDPETLKSVFQYSIKYATLLVAPAAGIVIALSEPGISTLFGHQYASAPLFLALLAGSYLYSAFGSLSIGNLINSQGQTQFNLKLAILTAAIGFPEGFLLISRFGILGLITTALTAGLPSVIISLLFIKRHYGATVDWTSSAKILLSSATAAAVTYVLTSYTPFNNLIKLVIGAIVFLFTFVVAISLTRTIDRSDIANLRAMLSGLGPLRPLLKLLLNIIEKIMTTLSP